MLRALILKELRGHLLSFRFLASFVTVFVLVVVTAVVLTGDYVRKVDEYSARQAELDRYLRSYAHFNRIGGVLRAGPAADPLPGARPGPDGRRQHGVLRQRSAAGHVPAHRPDLHRHHPDEPGRADPDLRRGERREGGRDAEADAGQRPGPLEGHPGQGRRRGADPRRPASSSRSRPGCSSSSSTRASAGRARTGAPWP